MSVSVHVQRSAPRDADLLLLIEVVQDAVGLRFEPEAVSRSLARSSDRGALQRIAETAPRLGLVAKEIVVDFKELPRLVGAGQPLLLSDDHGGGVLAVLDADGRRLKVVDAEYPHGIWMSAKELASRFEVGRKGQSASGLLLDAAAPMSALSFPGSPPGDVPTALRRLRGLLVSEWADVQAIIIYAVGAGIFTLTIPVAVQSLVNTVAFGALLQPLVAVTTLVIAGLAMYGLLTALEVYVVEILQRRILLRVVGDLAYRVPRARATALDRVYGPEHLNRFFDVFTIHKATAQLLIDGLDLVLKATIGLLLLAFYHPFLFAFDVVLIVALALVLFGLGQGGLKTAVIESKKKYRLAGWLEELGRRPFMFKSNPGLRMAQDRADSYARDFILARVDHFKVVFRQTIGSLAIYALASGLLLGLGGWLVLQGQLTLGQLVASELVLTSVVTAFAKMGKHAESFYDLVAAVDKVGALFDLPVERGGGDGGVAEVNRTGSSFEMSGVSIDLSGKTVLKCSDLRLEPGEKVALLGRGGSGKSVFADMLFGLRTPSSGTLRLDDVHIEDIPLGVLRDRVSVARCDDVMHGSVVDNIRLGNANLDDVEIRKVLQWAYLDEVVEKLSEGMETIVFPGGRPLTEAQAARLSIARAMADNPTLLVIDGLLDSQDEDIRRGMLRYLTSSEATWTLVVLTRQESLAHALPRAVVLEGGQTTDLKGGAS